MIDRQIFYIRSAIRALRRTPVLSVAAVVSLALGIGANAAIFSAFNQALLQRLPVPQPHQLVTLSAPGEKRGRVSSSNSGGSDAVFSYPLFRDLERGQQAMTGLAAHREVPANISHRGRTSNEMALLVSGSYFPVLGVRPALGRLLRTRRRPDFRGASRCRPQPCVLALPLRRGPVNPQRHPRDQR